MSQYVFPGRPTRRQAERLVAFVVALGEDKVVTHEQIEGLIEVGRLKDQSRYYSVVHAAKQRLEREHGVALLTEVGVGYRYPTGDAQLKSSVGHIRRGVKQIGRGVKVGGRVSDKRLTSKGCEMRDHIVGQAKYLFELGKTRRKELELTVGKTGANPQQVKPGV